jgi:hypothetical protein
MRAPMILAGLLGALMFALIAWATVNGSFGAEGSALYALPWGKVTLADLYTGFALFSGWVIYREKSTALGLVFVVLVMTLGNAFAALYVLVALLRSRGDSGRFWLGHRFVEKGR